MIVFHLMIAAPFIALFVMACYGIWLFGGWCMDRFDAWRARRYVEWHRRQNERHFR